jgi:ABC-type amino acid transport system permease subunit
MVQIMIIYFGLNSLGARLPAFAAGIMSLSINSGAYIAEIFRSGIQAVDAGQSEAALALGMSEIKALRLIILPQAVRNILPALVNEFITVIKESSLVSFATVAELTFAASRVRGATFRAVEPYLLSAVIYFILTFTLSKCLGILERRLHSNDRAA